MLSLITITIGGVIYAYQWYKEPLKLYDQVKADQRKIIVAAESWFVDNCNHLDSANENYIPPRLTTPIAYLPKLPKDPFSQSGETYRHISEIGRANSAVYYIVSQGPDRDWNIDRLPLTATKDDVYYFNSDVVAYRAVNNEEFIENTEYNESEYGIWKSFVGEVKKADGSTLYVGQKTILALPSPSENESSYESYHQFFATYMQYNNIPTYDPTNGLRSNGDIFKLSIDSFNNQ
jgi:hypothetical protein